MTITSSYVLVGLSNLDRRSQISVVKLRDVGGDPAKVSELLAKLAPPSDPELIGVPEALPAANSFGPAQAAYIGESIQRVFLPEGDPQAYAMALQTLRDHPSLPNHLRDEIEDEYTSLPQSTSYLLKERELPLRFLGRMNNDDDNLPVPYFVSPRPAQQRSVPWVESDPDRVAPIQMKAMFKVEQASPSTPFLWQIDIRAHELRSVLLRVDHAAQTNALMELEHAILLAGGGEQIIDTFYIAVKAS